MPEISQTVMIVMVITSTIVTLVIWGTICAAVAAVYRNYIRTKDKSEQFDTQALLAKMKEIEAKMASKFKELDDTSSSNKSE